MTIAQTSQLIQLILNSALMIAVTVLTLGAVWLRHTTVVEQWHSQHRSRSAGGKEGTFAAAAGAPAPGGQRLQIGTEGTPHLPAQYQLTRLTTLIMHIALVVFVTSLFLLALRSLLNLGWLIPLAMLLFLGGTGFLLAGAGLLLLDFYQFGFSLQAHPRRAAPARRRRTTRQTSQPIPPLAVPTSPLELPRKIG
jgi:hypothetical protein